MYPQDAQRPGPPIFAMFSGRGVCVFRYRGAARFQVAACSIFYRNRLGRAIRLKRSGPLLLNAGVQVTARLPAGATGPVLFEEPMLKRSYIEKGQHG